MHCKMYRIEQFFKMPIFLDCHLKKEVRVMQIFRKEKLSFSTKDLWNTCVENNKSLNEPVTNITVDMHLYPTKARCKFT